MVAVLVREEHPLDVLGVDQAVDLLEPVLAVHRGAGVDDDRLLAEDHHRVHRHVGAGLGGGEVRDQVGVGRHLHGGGGGDRGLLHRRLLCVGVGGGRCASGARGDPSRGRKRTPRHPQRRGGGGAENPSRRGVRDRGGRRTVRSMRASGLLPRTVDAVERVTARAADGDELLEGVAAEVRKAVPYDGGMWFGIDPTTFLAVAPARMESLDAGYCNAFWFGEFHEQDANLFADLARDASPAGTLRTATDDRPMRSARYRDFLKPQGYDDELRVMFRTGNRSWGAAGLFRDEGRDPFDERRRRRPRRPSRRSWLPPCAPTRRCPCRPRASRTRRASCSSTATARSSRPTRPPRAGWPTSTTPIPAPTGSLIRS